MLHERNRHINARRLFNRPVQFLYSLLLFITVFAVSGIGYAEDLASRIPSELSKGVIVPRVTDVNEFKSLFGSPIGESSKPDGGGTLTEMIYPDNIRVIFKQMTRESSAALARIKLKGKYLDLGKTVLRNTGDLAKLDKFTGLEGVSLVKLDLRQHKDAITQLSFDSLTEWPAKNMLPDGFDPEVILENGKDPGLGVRQLHEDDIDGRGVGIAVIDQPLLLGHQEYVSRLIYYNALGMTDVEPQMHGPAVAGFAVGKDIGIAPGAALYYFATPSWITDNIYRTEALKTIIELNKNPLIKEKIRVVSISHGRFKTNKNYDKWDEALKQADAAGILVITCDPSTIDFGTLTRSLVSDPALPESYVPESWDDTPHPIWVPGGGRSHASYKGETVYTFEITSGKSWSTPYLTGVAALGYQLNPELRPERVKELLIKSATLSKAGAVINPKGFIELVRETVDK